MTTKRMFLIAALALAGCGNSKADQCSKVIAGYNAVGEAMRKGFGDGSDPAAIEANVAAIEAASKALTAAEVRDAGLLKVRGELAALFTRHATTMRAMAGAVRDSKDPARADASAKALASAATEAQATAPAISAAKLALMAECNATAK